jgi:hypothetical protein
LPDDCTSNVAPVALKKFVPFGKFEVTRTWRRIHVCPSSVVMSKKSLY